jgi:hypothetical protein
MRVVAVVAVAVVLVTEGEIELVRIDVLRKRAWDHMLRRVEAVVLKAGKAAVGIVAVLDSRDAGNPDQAVIEAIGVWAGRINVALPGSTHAPRFNAAAGDDPDRVAWQETDGRIGHNRMLRVRAVDPPNDRLRAFLKLGEDVELVPALIRLGRDGQAEGHDGRKKSAGEQPAQQSKRWRVILQVRWDRRTNFSSCRPSWLENRIAKGFWRPPAVGTWQRTEVNRCDHCHTPVQ